MILDRRIADAASLVLAAVAVVPLGLLMLRYVGVETYFDHAEVDFAIRSWLAASGEELYRPADSPFHVVTVYGPVPHLISAVFLTIAGPGIAASKLGGIFAALAGVVLFGDFARRTFGLRWLGLGVLAYVSLMMFSAPNAFWTRPDPFLVLFVTAAVWATSLKNRWASCLLIALFAGLAVNAKVHSAIFFVPIVLRYATGRWWITWPVMGLVAAAAALAPFALPNVSLVNYLEDLGGMVRSRRIDPAMLLQAIRYGSVFAFAILTPLLLAILRRPLPPRRDLAYFAVFLVCLATTLYPASVPGASWYHLLPFAAISCDVFLRFAVHADRQLPRWASRTTMGVLALVLVILTVTPTRQIGRVMAGMEGWSAAAAAEVEAILASHPSASVEMGAGKDYQETYRHTFVRPILAFHGQPWTVSTVSVMEETYSGRPVPKAKLQRLEACATDLWLIPTGEQPFIMYSYFVSRPAYWPEYAETFESHYRLLERHRFFDVWGCRPDRAS